MHLNAKSYLEIAKGKREQRQKRIPKAWLLSQDQIQSRDLLNLPEHCGILTEREFRITQTHDAVDIVNGIASGKLSAREVAVAFCKRAAIAQQVVSFSFSWKVKSSFLTKPDQLLDRNLL
jgi:amidase